MKPTLLFGDTRTHVAPRHALIASDSHVPSSIPGFTNVTAIVLISPAMGARFTQLLVTFPDGGSTAFPADGVESLAYVVEGSLTAEIGGKSHALKSGGYVFAPAGTAWKLHSPTAGTQITVFQKVYVPLAGTVAPTPVIGDEKSVASVPFLGDENARLQLLLPDVPSFDLGVNIFNYVTGTTLPFVETHIMEHGLLMLAGQGIYRLEDSWYPVAAGDVIWMAPYCPQWFVAMGKTPSRYLYYKDINRTPSPALPA